MKIALIGQAAFGEKVLEALLDQGEDVIAVFAPPDDSADKVDPITAAARAANIPVHQFSRLRDQEAIDAFQDLTADLGIMAFVTDIVPEAILTAPTHGTIQYHPSLLPKHRGPSSMNWPIIQGETRTGLTIFWPDAGIDTGPVLLQKEVDIAPDDTLGSLYFGKLFPMGVEAIAEAVNMVKSGTAPRIEQDESQATYEGWCRAEDVQIDWSRPVNEIYNLIRGADPSPGAGSTLDGTAVQFYDAAKESGDAGGVPGEVLSVDGEGIRVAAPGGAIRIGRVRPKGAGKQPASEWATSIGLKPGRKFGT